MSITDTSAPSTTPTDQAKPGPASPNTGSAATALNSAKRPPSGPVGPAKRSELTTDQGKTSIADSVVAKIAGVACREVSGVHAMGSGMTSAFGAIKDKIASSEPSPSRGVSVEVGERQAAIDVDIIVENGSAIVDVASAIRQNIISQVETMTGLEVAEVNVTVDDVFLGETEAPPAPPRVQ
jgi:uncharacterized alkaline shock family protein YloU